MGKLATHALLIPGWAPQAHAQNRQQRPGRTIMKTEVILVTKALLGTVQLENKSHVVSLLEFLSGGVLVILKLLNVSKQELTDDEPEN